jgi:hypothetical protein
MTGDVKLTDRPEYAPWSSMVSRCTKPSYTGFHKYGGAGITVFPAWIGPEGFARFCEHIGPRPSLGHQIDRIDSFGNYEPGNVRWATTREQARNRRSNLFIEYDGRTMCAADWASELGITRQSFQKRLEKWPLERVMTEGRRSYAPAGRHALGKTEGGNG